jgi:FtsP/CotA-like multicopper oxidase with cupredoxin domain
MDGQVTPRVLAIPRTICTLPIERRPCGEHLRSCALVRYALTNPIHHLTASSSPAPVTTRYHDHAVHITADNAYAGLAGLHVVKDCDWDVEVGYLPSEEHSLPLVMRDAVIDTQPPHNLVYQGGHINQVGAHQSFLYGDINIVNGKPWPKQSVERTTYRFRGLNASITRQFNLKFLAESRSGKQAWVPMYMVQADGGAYQNYIQTYSLFLAVAERYSFLVNFDPSSAAFPNVLDAGDEWAHVYLVNDFGPSGLTPPSFCKSHLLVRFDIGSVKPAPRGVDLELATSLPSVLGQQGKPYTAMQNLIPDDEIAAAVERAFRGEYDRDFKFGRTNGRWVVNGCLWEDESCRIIANPKRNGVELWRVETGGGWSHPIHVHEIDFRVIRREGGRSDLYVDHDGLKPNGNPAPEFITLPDTARDIGVVEPWAEAQIRPWEYGAPKDVVHLGNGQTVYFLARFGLNDGDFMLHCHNLVHEDDDMMVAFGIGRTKVASAADHLSPHDQGAEFWTVAGDGSVVPDNDWAITDPEGDGFSPFAPQVSGSVDTQLRDATGDTAILRTLDTRFRQEDGRVDRGYACERLCRKIYAGYFPTNEEQMQLRAGSSFIRNNVWAADWKQYQCNAQDATAMQRMSEYQSFAADYVDHADAKCDCTPGGADLLETFFAGDPFSVLHFKPFFP